jgi:hypothetical protein
MNIFRLLVLAGIVWLVYKILQSWRIDISRRDSQTPDRFEPMTRCAGCGLYLPSQSLSSSGRCGACEKNRS